MIPERVFNNYTSYLNENDSHEDIPLRKRLRQYRRRVRSVSSTNDILLHTLLSNAIGSYALKKRR